MWIMRPRGLLLWFPVVWLWGVRGFPIDSSYITRCLGSSWFPNRFVVHYTLLCNSNWCWLVPGSFRLWLLLHSSPNSVSSSMAILLGISLFADTRLPVRKFFPLRIFRQISLGKIIVIILLAGLGLLLGEGVDEFNLSRFEKFIIFEVEDEIYWSVSDEYFFFASWV